MGLKEIINKFKQYPITKERIIKDLQALGLKPGMTVIVHVSMSSIGFVIGSEVSIIKAIEKVINPGGTLIMPAHSADLSEPSVWTNPPVPESWWPIIREHTPAFDKNLTPTRYLGKIPEVFRKQEGVLRSNHPQVSFCARGPNAERITDDHQLSNSLGESSPLARIYDCNGWVLLLGVDHSTNTSLHLSEYRAHYKTKKAKKDAAPIMENGKRVWKEFDDIDYNSDDFGLIGIDFNRDHEDSLLEGSVGYASALLFKQRLIVDYGVTWMEKHR